MVVGANADPLGRRATSRASEPPIIGLNLYRLVYINYTPKTRFKGTLCLFQSNTRTRHLQHLPLKFVSPLSRSLTQHPLTHFYPTRNCSDRIPTADRDTHRAKSPPYLCKYLKQLGFCLPNAGRYPGFVLFTMSNTDFLTRAIDVVKKAIESDNAGEYEKAYQLYYQSLELFMLALKWEKNAKSKEMIRGKAGEYMERAEKLKTHLADGDKSNRKKPAAVGSNGKVSGSGGKGK